MRKVKKYTLYDIQNAEQLVLIGDAREIAIFLNVSVNCIWSALSRGSLIRWRYRAEELIE